jgi:hypothetical protein
MFASKVKFGGPGSAEHLIVDFALVSCCSTITSCLAYLIGFAADWSEQAWETIRSFEIMNDGLTEDAWLVDFRIKETGRARYIGNCNSRNTKPPSPETTRDTHCSQNEPELSQDTQVSDSNRSWKFCRKELTYTNPLNLA